MSADAQVPPPVLPVDTEDVRQELLRAARNAALDSSGSKDPREVRELGQGALAFAQAAVVLDPTLIAPQGVTPEVLAAATPIPPPAETDES